MLAPQVTELLAASVAVDGGDGVLQALGVGLERGGRRGEVATGERGARGDAREVHVLLEQRRQAGAQGSAGRGVSRAA